jgi:WD40 repeat protein
MGVLRAVKIVERRQFESDRPYEREFAGIQRYEPVSRSVDGLVHVLHVGRNEVEGYFYYVMELADSVSSSDVSGQIETQNINPEAYSPRTLRSDMKRLGLLPIADCLRVALDLVGGLTCLHRHGLIHRDVKPGNIIFVNGRAKLADIGLVSTRTEGRTFVGTEGYIPPEGPGSPAADLYALGMVLYEAVTGYPPERFPKVPPEWFAEDADTGPLEFHEVVLKACEGAKERRYQSAEELQADLALLQSGHSVRRVRALQRRASRSRRLALVAVLAGIVAVGSILLGNYRIRVEKEQRAREQVWREEAEQAQVAAERAERQERQQLLIALIEQARANVRGGELGQRFHTLDAVRRAATLTNSPVLRQTALAALVLPDLRFEREIALPPDTTVAVLDPAFERLALGRGTNAVEIRSMADGSTLAMLPASTELPAELADWSHDGRFVVITRVGKTRASKANVEVWELPSARRVLTLPPTFYGAGSFHPRLPRLIAAHLEDTVGVWDLETGRETARFAVTGMVHHVKYSPDGDSFVVQHRTGRPWFTSLLAATNGAVRSSTLSGWVDGIAWHPQDKFVALAARQGDVYLHNRATGETTVLGRHKNEARTAVFSPDGAFLFTGGEEHEIICWDLATRQRAFTLAARSAQIQFAGAGTRCAVLTRNGLLLHELVRPAACRELPADLGATVRHAAFSPDGRWLAAGGLNALGVWDLSSDTLPVVAPMTEHATPFFSPDSRELFAYSIERLGRWRLERADDSSPRLRELPVPETGRVHSGQFSGQSLILAANAGLLVYPSADEARREVLGIFSVHASISFGGKWLVATRADRMNVYTFQPWSLLKHIPVDSEIVDHVFSPSDDELAIATASGVSFVNARDWKTQRRLPAALDRRARVLFAPDGRSFWLAHDARTAALHDARALALLLPLTPGVLPLAVSPDGNRLLVSIDGRRLQLWDWAALRRELEELGLGWGR